MLQIMFNKLVSPLSGDAKLVASHASAITDIACATWLLGKLHIYIFASYRLTYLRHVCIDVSKQLVADIATGILQNY